MLLISDKKLSCYQVFTLKFNSKKIKIFKDSYKSKGNLTLHGPDEENQLYNLVIKLYQG